MAGCYAGLLEMYVEPLRTYAAFVRCPSLKRKPESLINFEVHTQSVLTSNASAGKMS